MISLGVVRYSCSWLSSVVSLLLTFVIYSSLFWTGGVRSHLNYSTQRAPRSSLRNLCSLVTFTMFSLLFAAANTLFCYTLIFLELEKLRILPLPPAVMRPRISLVSFCTVQLRNFCPACSLAILWFSKTSGLGQGFLTFFTSLPISTT